MNDHYEIIGLMSGTSLDGLDIAYCKFDKFDEQWQYSISNAKTYNYDNAWKDRLISAETADARTLVQLHSEFGNYCGTLVNRFISETGLNPSYIASHGHTVFHRPDIGYTFQLGNGAIIAGATGITTICDFRAPDIALGGQGAPLVPVGDKLLFGNYALCLNIGGFANISYDSDGKRIAFDVCPANIILNLLANKSGVAFDRDGEIASAGSVIPELLDALEGLSFYHIAPPKSLGKEWLTGDFLPVLDNYSDHPSPDLMRTLCEHIALMIADAALAIPGGQLLITGGGGLNKFLVSRISKHCHNSIVIPDLLTVQFKEALIFAFLGLLRLRGEVNCLSSVTGAKKDHCSGAVYFGG